MTSARILTVAVFAMGRLAFGQSADTTVVRVQTPPEMRARLLDEQVVRARESAGVAWKHVLLFPSLHRGLFVVALTDPYDGAVYRSTLTEFDSAGKFVRTIGGPVLGQGRSGRLGVTGTPPGEFQGWIGSVVQLDDGRILATDARGILVFAQDGTPLARWDATGNSLASGGSIFVDPAGFIYLSARRRVDPRTTQLESFLYRFRADGTLVDEVPPPEASFERHHDPYQMPRAHVPFGPQYLSAWSPAGYFVTAYSSAYAIDIPARRAGLQRERPTQPWLESAPVTSLRRSPPPIPVQPAERDDWKLSVTTFARSPTPGPWENWQWSGPDIPANKAPINLLSVDPDGRIWVRLAQAGQLHPEVVLPTMPAAPSQGFDLLARKRWIEPFVFDVLEPTGRMVGQVRLPDGTGHPDLRGSVPQASFAATGGILWVAVYDDDGVPTIKRYRIAWPGKP
jgi:hypothetical protein